MSISKLEAEQMQARVNAGNLRSKQRGPETAAMVGERPERGSGAVTGQPKRKKNPEYDIQAEYVRRMEQKYPLVMVFSDTAAHIFKTKLQQIRANKLQSKLSKDWPDVFVAQPSGDYAGLFLEFKAKTPYLKDGFTLSSDKHLQAQRNTMEELTQRGYQCWFVWSVEMAINATEKYLNL